MRSGLSSGRLPNGSASNLVLRIIRNGSPNRIHFTSWGIASHKSKWLISVGSRFNQERHYGFWSELQKSLKDRTEDNKEIKDALTQLKEDETLAKTKESLGKLGEKSREGVEKVRKAVESQTAASGEMLKGGATKVADMVQDTWDKVKEKTKIDETISGTVDKTMHTFDKTVEYIDKTGENLQRSAEQSALYKRTQELSQKVAQTFGQASKNVPLLGGKDSSQQDGTGTAPPHGAIVINRTADVIQQRIRDATTKLRNTTLYKNAVKFKEKIAESENPVIQKTLEWSDATSYHLGRMRRRLFSETETARAFNAIRAYVPKFDPMSFVDNARTQMIPKLRGALLRYDLDTIEPLVHPTFLQALRQEKAELYGEGSVHLSQLLETDNVEILAAVVDEGGLPVLYLGASTEETLHVKDANGKDWQNTAEDYIHRVKHQIWLQLNEQGEWIVNNWVEVGTEEQTW